jgi:hypothetical protein
MAPTNDSKPTATAALTCAASRPPRLKLPLSERASGVEVCDWAAASSAAAAACAPARSGASTAARTEADAACVAVSSACSTRPKSETR